eukprot:COSAG01_NODE_14483_length_1448_cov_1.261675_2_plen_39_part_01
MQRPLASTPALGMPATVAPLRCLLPIAAIATAAGMAGGA